MASEKWDSRFMGLCEMLAGWSEDEGWGVGCVIVGAANEIRSTGYSGLPRGVADDTARFDRPSGEKFHWFEHAERNAIFNAARAGTSLDGTRIYVNRFPCADCARSIIQSGIVEVVCPPRPEGDEKLDYSYRVSETMLEEAGIMVRTVGS